LADKTCSQIHTRDSNCSDGDKTAISDHTTSDSNCSDGDKTAITVHSSDLVCLSGDDKSAVTVLPALTSSIEERSDESPSCPVCDKPCGDHSRSIACDKCDKWLHYKWENLSQRDIKLYESDITNNYICHSCTNLIDQNITANNPDLDNENTLVKRPPSPMAMGSIVHKHAPTTVKSTNLCKQSNKNTEKNQESNLVINVENETETNESMRNPKHLDNSIDISTLNSQKSRTVLSASLKSLPTDQTERLTVNLYEQEILHLKDCLDKKENLLRAKDLTIYKLQSDISNLQKELNTSRSYVISLESDKLDLEHSLRIHK